MRSSLQATLDYTLQLRHNIPEPVNHGACIMVSGTDDIIAWLQGGILGTFRSDKRSMKMVIRALGSITRIIHIMITFVWFSGNILGMNSANHIVTSSLIRWAHTQNNVSFLVLYGPMLLW